MRFLFLSIFLLLFSFVPAETSQGATEDAVKYVSSPDDLDLIDVGTVVAIPKPDSIQLKNGRIYRLDQIRVPPQINEKATAYLKAALLGKKAGVYQNSRDERCAADEYGNKLGHIMLEDATWLQADMVSKGLAWAYSTETNYLLVRTLFKLEEKARNSSAGFWGTPSFGIKNDANIKEYLHSFQLYQGIKNDFVDTKNARIFRFFSQNDQPSHFGMKMPVKYLESTFNVKDKISLKNMMNNEIRIRGWVEEDEDGRLVIVVTHPQQIEYLTGKSSPPTPESSSK